MDSVSASKSARLVFFEPLLLVRFSESQPTKLPLRSGSSTKSEAECSLAVDYKIVCPVVKIVKARADNFYPRLPAGR